MCDETFEHNFQFLTDEQIAYFFSQNQNLIVNIRKQLKAVRRQLYISIKRHRCCCNGKGFRSQIKNLIADRNKLIYEQNLLAQEHFIRQQPIACNYCGSSMSRNTECKTCEIENAKQLYEYDHSFYGLSY